MATKIKEPKTEPKVRKDSKCVVCKKERPIGAIRNLDPFCSSPCCRKWYDLNNVETTA